MEEGWTGGTATSGSEAKTASEGWIAALEQRFELLGGTDATSPLAQALLGDLCDAMEAGTLRVATPTPAGWQVRPWLKAALITLSGASPVAAQPGSLPGTEIAALGWKEERSVRHRIPAGSFLRRGAFLSSGTVIMPPTTVQTGVWIGKGVRIDSHSLIGSCAQIGDGVILGSGSVLAGLLLPLPSLPVILEREVVLAGNCSIYGPVVVGEGTILHPGTILQASAGLYDAVLSRWITPRAGESLFVPAHVEVAMGLPPTADASAGIQQLTAMIVRRDSEAE